MQGLLDKESICKVGLVPGQYVSSYFAVPKSKRSHEKWRPILILKKFNRFTRHIYFTMKDVRTVRNWFQQGIMYEELDLKDTFLHFPMDAKVKRFFALNGRGNCIYGKYFLLVSNVRYEY